MRKTTILLLLFISAIHLSAQTKDSTINRVLKAMGNFREKENKRDSILGHPLGSNSEADFLRRFNFYDSVNKELGKISSNALAFAEQVDLELIKYSIADDIYSWQYKAYLNPILADEGFHTGLAGMGSQILSTKEEFEEYIDRLKDIPRFVNEYLALMREGLKLGISQPKNILNGYENTYAQHIITDVTKSVFWKPFLKKPFAINDADWKMITDEGSKAVLQY